jgi:hypothetical protein
VLFIGGKTQRLLLGAEMMDMMKVYKDGNHREFTVRDLANFKGGGKYSLMTFLFFVTYY